MDSLPEDAGAGPLAVLSRFRLDFHVADVSDFIEAISRVAQGGTVLDPEVVLQILGASRSADSLATLTRREREVLSLMAQGRSNAAIKYLE